jgi:autotransporter translocation and assembly factor TamB
MDEDGTIEETPVEEAEDVASGDVAEGDESPSPARRRRPLWRSLARAFLAALVLLVVGTVAFFTQTGRGQRVVLDELMGRIRGSLAGTLQVEGIESRSLLLGLTLRGVRLDAEGGRRFLVADSVVVRYSPLSLAIGSPRIRSTTFHGLEVEISPNRLSHSSWAW